LQAGKARQSIVAIKRMNASHEKALQKSLNTLNTKDLVASETLRFAVTCPSSEASPKERSDPALVLGKHSKTDE
jgi:hypothetical protein